MTWHRERTGPSESSVRSLAQWPALSRHLRSERWEGTEGPPEGELQFPYLHTKYQQVAFISGFVHRAFSIDTRCLDSRHRQSA